MTCATLKRCLVCDVFLISHYGRDQPRGCGWNGFDAWCQTQTSPFSLALFFQYPDYFFLIFSHIHSNLISTPPENVVCEGPSYGTLSFRNPVKRAT